MREKLTSWDAYLAGKMRLPPRYELEYGTDVLLLRRAEGSAAAAFSARGVAPSEVVWIAEEDYRTNGKSSALGFEWALRLMQPLRVPKSPRVNRSSTDACPFTLWLKTLAPHD